MSSAWLSAAIQEFEQVTLDNGTELFRVRARAQRGDDPEPRPVLVTREPDGTAHIYEPLSSGGDRRGLMRLAYTVPSDRIGPSTAFSLRLPDGYAILPEPTPGENRPEPVDDQDPEDAMPESEDQAASEPDRGAARRILQLEQELDELRSSTRSEHARLTAQVRQLRALIELQRADRSSARPGSDARLRHLEAEREQLAVHVGALAELLSTERTGDADGGRGLGGAAVNGAADRLGTLRARAVREANEHAERELRRLRVDAPR